MKMKIFLLISLILLFSIFLIGCSMPEFFNIFSPNVETPPPTMIPTYTPAPTATPTPTFTPTPGCSSCGGGCPYNSCGGGCPYNNYY